MDQNNNEEDDYQAASRSTANYADYEKPHKLRNPIWRKLAIILGALAVIAILAGVGYWFARNHKSSKKPAQSLQTTQTNTAPAASAINTSTKHYDSSNFNLGFDYPADWTVTDSGDGKLIVRSPSLKLKDVNGQSVNSEIIMNIRRSDQKLAEFDAGNATAAFDSEKIAYAKPTESQRANTYLSFLSYAGSSGGFNGIYITGDNGYKKDQAIPKVDIQKVDPIISVTFTKPDGSTGLNISTDNWDDDNFSQPLKSMLESLTIT